MNRIHPFLALLLPALACSRTSGEEIVPPRARRNTAVTTLTVTSSAFANGEQMPSRFTCEGDQVSPPLAWSEPPRATKSLALVAEDPDAPDPGAANKKTFVHWVASTATRS